MTPVDKPLVGKVCAVPSLNGRGRWWTKIIDQSPCGRFVRVAGGKMMGRARWIAARDAQEIRAGRKAKL